MVVLVETKATAVCLSSALEGGLTIHFGDILLKNKGIVSLLLT